MDRDFSNPLIYRKKYLARDLGVGLSTLDRLRADDPTFPKEVRLGKRTIGFLRSDVDKWLVSKRTS